MSRQRVPGDGPLCWCGADAVFSGRCVAHQFDNPYPKRPTPPIPTIHWDSCEVRYIITNPDAVRMLGTCEELPLGWVVGTVEPDPERRRYTLVFEVQGAPLESDGWIVRRILQRAGAL